MSSLNTLRLPDGEEVNVSEWIQHPVFSTVELAAGDPINLAAFSYTRSQVVPHTTSVAARSATEIDTNLVRSQKMNQDEAIVVYSLTYEIFGISDVTVDSPPLPVAPQPLTWATDVRRLQQQCIIELRVGAGVKKASVDVPFSYLNQAIGTTVYTSGDGGSVNPLRIQYGTGGCITPRAQRQLMLPIFIGGFGENAQPGNSMTFLQKFRCPTGAPLHMQQDFRIRFWLDGIKKRPA